MLDKLLRALGGLGLFLFGMSVMTQGPRGLAGKLLHRMLALSGPQWAGGAEGLAPSAPVSSLRRGIRPLSSRRPSSPMEASEVT